MPGLPQVIAIVGLAGAAAPAPAHVDAARQALDARVQAVRQQLAAAQPTLPPTLVAQAANWNNWPKWSKWSNWANG